MKHPFEIKFISPREIRMGSPYNLCNIKLVGKTNIKLEDYGWQDKCAWSNSNKYLVLVRWDIENDNTPGFLFFIYNTITGEKIVSERIKGILNNLSFQEHKIHYKKFLYGGKTEKEKLDSYSDHDYEFEEF